MRRTIEISLALVGCGLLGWAMQYCIDWIGRLLSPRPMPPEPGWTSLGWKLESELARLHKVEGCRK